MSEENEKTASDTQEEADSYTKDDDNGADDDDEEEHQMSFASYQLFLFVTCYLGYCIMLYNRKAFAFALPYVVMEEYFTSNEIGSIMSAQTVAYSISKFYFSWASDHYSPKYMFAGGLFLSGFVMLAFSDQRDWINIMALTSANGLAQGMGWPAVTKMLRAWFPPTQFGLWFAILTTALNLMGAVGPGIASSLAVSYGWRFGIQIPAMVAIIASVLVPYSTWDAPSSVGYEDQLTMFGKSQGHWSDLAGSEFMMFLASTYCALVVVKTACQDWGLSYLLQERGLSAQAASRFLTSMELGGLVGCIFLGALTDFMIRYGYELGTGKSPRLSVVQYCAACCCMSLNLFLFTIDTDTPKMYISLLGLFMGASMYGAIGLLGTIAVEVAPIHMTGSAHGAIGLAASMGTVVAGVPIHIISKNWDWFTAFMIINCVCILAFVIAVIGKDSDANFLKKGGPKKMSGNPLTEFIEGNPPGLQHLPADQNTGNEEEVEVRLKTMKKQDSSGQKQRVSKENSSLIIPCFSVFDRSNLTSSSSLAL